LLYCWKKSCVCIVQVQFCVYVRPCYDISNKSCISGIAPQVRAIIKLHTTVGGTVRWKSPWPIRNGWNFASAEHIWGTPFDWRTTKADLWHSQSRPFDFPPTVPPNNNLILAELFLAKLSVLLKHFFIIFKYHTIYVHRILL